MGHHKGSVVRRGAIKKGLIIGGCLLLNNALAGGPEAPPSTVTLFPTMPGVSLYGLGGNGWTGIGDAMVPVVGQPLNFTYLDPQIYYHSDDSEYTASVGAGQRWLTPSAGILGAYVFGDYNHSDNGNGFWFVSPGVERLGQVLDLSANLYIPVSSQRVNNGLEFADQAGDFSQITFAGHNQFDALVNTFDSVGWGGDAQIGVRLPFRNSEVYLGGYYFSPKDSDSIGGGAVRLQVPINNYFSALFSEAYDSQYHNTVKAGLTVWFGGRHTGYGFTGDLRERLVDPIQRNLIAVAGGSHTGQPVAQDVENTGQTALEVTNISFFVPNGAPDANATAAQGNGTFENPYVGMTQDNVDNANLQNNRNFYINSGTYNAVYGMTDPDYIVLNNDQLYGRQNGFRQNATGNGRALINFANGGFEVPDGDVNDSINGLRLTGTEIAGNAGIWIDHASSALDQIVTISNVQVQGFGDGIDVLNAASSNLFVTVNSSVISANSGGGELAALPINAEGGIAAVNSGLGSLTLNLKGSTVTDNDATLSNTVFYAVGGVAAANASDGSMTVNVTGSNISGNAVSATNSTIGAAGGLAVVNGDVVFGSPTSGTMDIHVNASSVSGNSFSGGETDGNPYTIGAVGGVAAVNQGILMTIDVNGSNLSGNTIVNTILGQSFIGIEAAGGLAVDLVPTGFTEQPDFIVPTVIVDVDHSNLSGNTIVENVTDASRSNISAAGGLAVFNGAGNMSVDVSRSNLSENSITNNVSGSGSFGAIDAAGGLAADNFGDELDIDVDRSNLSENSIVANVSDSSSSIMGAAGGLAARNAGIDMSVDVDRSSLSKNSIVANFTGSTSSTINAAGGLAAANFISDMSVDVNRSNLSQNSIATNVSNAQSTIDAAGGLAVDDFGSDLSIDVDHSSLSQNSIADTVANGLSSIGSAGGLAVAVPGGVGAPAAFANTIEINVEHSTLSRNSIVITDTDSAFSSFGSAGGLAVTNINNDIDIHVDHSSLSGNSIVANATADSLVFINTAGGLAVSNITFSGVPDEVAISVDHSSLSGNLVDLTNGNFIAVGGLAVSNANGSMSIDVDRSNISANSFVGTNERNPPPDQAGLSTVAGGLAVTNDAGDLTIDVSHSNLSGNSVDLTNDLVDVAGGIAISNLNTFNTTSTLDLTHSNVSGNSVSVNADNANIGVIQAAGGLAIANENSQMIVTVSGSKFLGNSVDVGPSASVIADGGIALADFGFGGENLEVNISRSVIVGNNPAGIDAYGPGTTVTVTKSIVAWNMEDALRANSDATIFVSNPIFFNGTVRFDTANAITFQQITPSQPNSGEEVSCLFGQCQIVVP